MLLAVDIGNTNLVFGIFDGKKLIADWRVSTNTGRTADEYELMIVEYLMLRGIKPEAVKQAILGSVVPPLTRVLGQAIEKLGMALLYARPENLKVKIKIDNPRDVGIDRLLNSLAGYKLYRGPLVLVDFGTATTLDALSSRGEYLGGAIAPGILISRDALYQHTARLPKVEISAPRSVIGKDTVSAMQSGLLYGYVGLLEGLVRRFKSELGIKTKVVATGGQAGLIRKYTRVIDLVNPNLTLEGLRIVWEGSK